MVECGLAMLLPSARRSCVCRPEPSGDLDVGAPN